MSLDALSPNARQRLALLVLDRLKRARQTRDAKLAQNPSHAWLFQMEAEVTMWKLIFDAVGGHRIAGLETE